MTDRAALQIQVCLSSRPNVDQLASPAAVACHCASPDSVLSCVEWGLERDIIDQINTVPRTNSEARPLSPRWAHPSVVWLQHCPPGSLVRGTRQEHTRHLGDRALRRTSHRNGRCIAFHKTNRKEPRAAAERRSSQTQPQMSTPGRDSDCLGPPGLRSERGPHLPRVAEGAGPAQVRRPLRHSVVSRTGEGKRPR